MLRQLQHTQRMPAVAGLFYPGDRLSLHQVVSELLAQAVRTDLPSPPKALIVPHAGYPYSGSVAASAYALLKPIAEQISRVVLIGPSHRTYLQGVALPQAEIFVTPFGEVAVDPAARQMLLNSGQVVISDVPHAFEHCLEVQLPFLQTLLPEFTLVPLVAGQAAAEYVASVLEPLWGGPETLVLASSDLSHYHPYDLACEIDRDTARAILARESDLVGEQACGAVAINGLMVLAHKYNLQVTEIARLNSGDTAGDRKRVVGYGAYALHQPRAATTS